MLPNGLEVRLRVELLTGAKVKGQDEPSKRLIQRALDGSNGAVTCHKERCPVERLLDPAHGG